MKSFQIKICIDAREFIPGRKTGIGRVVEGLADTLTHLDLLEEILLAVSEPDAIPTGLGRREKIRSHTLPVHFLRSEKALSDLTRTAGLLISPYPKLPLFGCHCTAVHTVHDILDLTHPAYRKRLKVFFDRFRLKTALKKADLTWYDSSWSLEETRKTIGFVGKNPKIRYPGLDPRFVSENQTGLADVLNQHQLQPGYILAIGNGLPHKNLGVLLEISNQITRKLVFVGVPEKNQGYWLSKYPNKTARWIHHIDDEDLPEIIRNAFCVAQPSTAEGYGYPPLEAMACGTPSVISRIPVLLETTGGHAITVDPFQPKEWLQAFEALEGKNTYRKQVASGLKWTVPLRGQKGWAKHLLDIEEIMM